ncbi:IS66 family transposase [Streptosporangium sp. NBC_01495]|uniref:IS66 family transposase n=1 Tax=Streptosporangium sp. NBC_01495 TaxID=2903899 RepID=UPI003FCE8CFB
MHQLCCSHLLRDLEDCAETYPEAAWPTQIQTALRGLIHAANLARRQSKDAIEAGTKAMWLKSFRHGVRVGLSQVRRLPGPAKTVAQPFGRVLLEVLRDREDDVLRFAHDLLVPPTNNQAERDVRPAKTHTPSAATSPPPPNTAQTSWRRSATLSWAAPGCHPTRHQPEPGPQPATAHTRSRSHTATMQRRNAVGVNAYPRWCSPGTHPAPGAAPSQGSGGTARTERGQPGGETPAGRQGLAFPMHTLSIDMAPRPSSPMSLLNPPATSVRAFT